MASQRRSWYYTEVIMPDCGVGEFVTELQRESRLGHDTYVGTIQMKRDAADDPSIGRQIIEVWTMTKTTMRYAVEMRARAARSLAGKRWQGFCPGTQRILTLPFSRPCAMPTVSTRDIKLK
jgi:hypothetical protein